MTDAWPASLPQKLNRGYSSGFGDGLIESQPDTGVTQTRLRSSNRMRPLSGQMKMTKAQKAALTTFFETTIRGGSLPFNFPDPEDCDTNILVKFAKGRQPKWIEINADAFMVEIELMIMP